jgi:hypothetical protein
MERRGRGDVDDATPALVEHARQERPTAQERAREVDGDRVEPGCRVALRDRRHGTEGSRRVDQDRRRAQLARHLAGEPLDVVGPGDVGSEPRDVTRYARHGCAAPLERVGYRLADTAARSGDHGDSPAEVRRHAPVSR